MHSRNPFPRRLKAARAIAGLSQKKLGVQIGIEESSASSRMNHYEKGRHVPDFDTLKRMAEALGVPAAYFFCNDDVLAELVCLLDRLPASRLRQLTKELRNEVASSDIPK